MGGITTGIGIFSGIDTASLIDQLLQIEARPITLAQSRLIQLQTQQAAFLDINSRMLDLKTASSVFRTANTFGSMRATSSDSDVLTASANTSAAEGTYSFLVDRLVSTQQMLSRGFADLDTSAFGASSFTFEPAEGRLDSDTSLSDLNSGSGVERGKIIIAEDGGSSVTIDLSRVADVDDVIAAINGNGVLDLTATVKGDHFEISHNDPSTDITISNAVGYDTATSLGIEQATAANTITGTQIYLMSDNMSIRSLNDGNGIDVGNSVSLSAYDFIIQIAGETDTTVNLGDVYSDITEPPDESAVTTIGGILTRINDALEANLGTTDVRAEINSAGTGINIVDDLGRAITVVENTSRNGTTAADLGILGSATAQLNGEDVLAGLNSTLVKHLNGGSGVDGTGQVQIFDREGNGMTVNLDLTGSVSDLIEQINDEAVSSGVNIVVEMDDVGTGIRVRDTSASPILNLIVVSNDTTESLGIATDPAGVAANSVESGNLQHQYLSLSTTLSSMRNGLGVGTGTIEITDSIGAVAVMTIDDDTKTIGDFIDEFNSRGLRAQARLNSNGDGIEIYEEVPGGGSPGGVEMSIVDSTGSVAKFLNVSGTAPGTDADNVIDGSFEEAVEFEATDTLQDVVDKINSAGTYASVSIINDGTGTTPYRLSLTSRDTGAAGRFTLDSGSFDLGLTTLDEGENSRVFFGSDDPATGVLLSNSSNTLDNVITGVTIDLLNTSDEAVTLSVTRNLDEIESKVQSFIDTFNTAVDRITFQGRYVQETEERGPLLGDYTTITLRNELFSTLQEPVDGVTGTYTRLVEVGVEVGEGGRLSFDRDAFRDAYETDPEAVEAIFAEYDLIAKEPEEISPGVFVNNTDGPDEFNSIGVLGQIEQLIVRYTDSIDGIISLRSDALTDQIQLQNSRIENLNEALLRKRDQLEAQFLAMEQAIAQLQIQQSALSTISFS